MGHVIQKQLFSLSASDAQQVREWEGKLHSLVHQVINPCIEKYFNEISAHDNDIVIDQLDIDLGVLNNKNPHALEERIREQLQSQLQDLPKIATVANESSTRDKTFSDQSSIEEKSVQEFTQHKKYFVSFLNFLRRGVLPWWAETENVQLDDAWVKNITPREADQVAALVVQYPECLRRILFQFGDNFIAALIRHHLGDETDKIHKSWQTLARHYSPQVDQAELYQQFWKYWIERSFGITPNSSALGHAVARWFKSAPEAIEALINVEVEKDEIRQADIMNSKLIPSKHLREILLDVCRRDSTLNALPSLRRFTSNQLVNPSVDFKPLSIGSAGHTQLSPGGHIEAEKNADTTFTSDKKHEAAMHKRDDCEDEDKNELYVSGAGIIILHPFLTELFTSTGLWNKNEWTSPDAQHLAVQLITFLSFGTSTLPEYQLALPKILVNMPLSVPLNNSCELPDPFKQTAEELLQAVIGHWKVLGNTSSDGLREGFIQREGKILRKNDDWHLTVENKAQDILLARLPWSISFIHLPWLNKSNLHVKWTD